ncbi:MAG: FAD:protein FMN transferase [Thermoguttaceae bacterium]|nr:FAD:protein FMN transferase [Thermoguttaceae bacterium]
MPNKKTQKTVSAENVEERPQGSNSGLFIRVGIVALLVLYMLKPYLLDKPKTDENRGQVFAVEGKTMGTYWSALVCASTDQLLQINNDEEMTSDEEEPIDACETLLAKIVQKRLDFVDSIASTYRADSEISKFNASDSTDWFDVSPETAEIVSIAQKVSKNTGGAFDITVAPLVNLYRFGPNKAPLVALPSDEQIDAIKQNVGYDKLEVRAEPKPGLKKSIPSLTIDLSGVAKGFAADLAGKALEERGLTSYMLEVGGEIRCRGEKILDPDADDSKKPKTAPWTLGIEKPATRPENENEREAPELYRVLRVGSNENAAALATSGDYRNYRQVGDVRFSHILDPRTGKPTEIVDEGAASKERLGSVSVASSSADAFSCAEADAYATGLFVLGAKEGSDLAQKLGVPALFLVRKDDSAAELVETSTPAFDALDSKTMDEFLEEKKAEKKEKANKK